MGGFVERQRRTVLGRFYAKWSADLALNGAILIAWQAQFSLVPLVLGLLGLLGVLWRDPAQRAALVTAVVSQFPEQIGDLLGFMEETRQLSGLLGLASVVGLAWSGYWLFQTMAEVFNHFYQVPGRSVLGQLRITVILVAIYAVLMPVSVFASGIPTYLAVLSDRVLPFDVPGVAVVTGWLVSLGSATLMFLALYRIVPNRPLSVAQVWPGAALAGVLFVLFGQVFPLYLRLFGGTYSAYKSLGLFLLLMTWVYCLAVVAVLGAELNAFRCRFGSCPDLDGTEPSPAPSDPSAHRFSPSSSPHVPRAAR
jgi:membrane protein